MSLYRKIFKKSLFITWNNKYLWFFGLFAAVLGAIGKYEVSLNKISGDLQEGLLPWFSSLWNSEIFASISWSSTVETFQANPVSFFIIIGLFLILLILAVFFIWLTIISQVGLINNSAEAFKTNKKRTKSGIKEGVLAGVKNFWPALGLNVIIKTLVYILFALLALSFIAVTTGVNSQLVGVTYVILFIVFIPLALILSLLLKYAVCFLVIKQEKFLKSLEKSWHLFINNWLVSIEMAAILFVFQFLLTGALILIMLTFSIPFVLLALLTANFFVSAFSLVINFSLLLGIILMFFFGAIFTTFAISSWTGLFLELSGNKNVLSKIIRLVYK